MPKSQNKILIVSRTFYISLKYNDYIFVYTDASKNNTKVGIGIYIPQLDYKFSARLHDHLNICDAEMIALYKGMKICMEKGQRHNFLFTDSASALERLKNANFQTNIDFITLSIKHIITTTTPHYTFKFTWIPGHSHIDGNEQADKLAKVGTIISVPLNIPVDKHNYLPFLKNNINQHFYTKWQQEIQNKAMDRRHVSSLIRMKTGHCWTKSHLFRIGVSSSPHCDCGQLDTLEHTFLECPINSIPGYDIYQQLVKKGIPAPLNMSTVLGSLHFGIIKTLVYFITYNHIKL
nr:uncharacterized protein LOC111502541 [Leptinotarsa decemlineata]